MLAVKNFIVKGDRRHRWPGPPFCYCAGSLRSEGGGSAYDRSPGGGVYALVDHTRRHMQELDNENGHRVDPVQAIKEIEAAGFEFVDYSDLHYRPDDELRYRVQVSWLPGTLA